MLLWNCPLATIKWLSTQGCEQGRLRLVSLARSLSNLSDESMDYLLSHVPDTDSPVMGEL